MPPLRHWVLARPPNYEVNNDKKYPYSEVPHIGEYRLVKIPIEDELIDLIDYWGEGRIDYDGAITGFSSCYNVNHQFQLVSNGKDRDRKIPNRIPVRGYNNCSTEDYIKKNSVRVVTVMAAPINESCAKDIGRIIHGNEGKVVIYGFEENSEHVKCLERELIKKELIFCPDYDLPETLQGLTLFDSYRSYLNLTELKDKVCDYIRKGTIEKALEITANCIENKKEKILKEILDKLLETKASNIMIFMYKLWENNKNITDEYLPKPFKLIFDGKIIKIINVSQNMALKVDDTVNENGDRQAWGDGVEAPDEQLQWKFTPAVKDNKLYFQIENITHNIKLKLANKSNEYGDRLCFGSSGTNTTEQLFNLKPIKKENEIIFLIFDDKTGQSLLLDGTTDEYGNRKLWANDYYVENDNQRFGWKIRSIESK